MIPPDEVFEILTTSFDEGGIVKEVYRSFEGKLGVENQTGYIIYEIEDYYEIHSLDVERIGAEKVRVAKDEKFDWSDLCEIGRICCEVSTGKINGQANYRGKWYRTETIKKIQADHQDFHWQRYV